MFERGTVGVFHVFGKENHMLHVITLHFEYWFKRQTSQSLHL